MPETIFTSNDMTRIIINNENIWKSPAETDRAFAFYNETLYLKENHSLPTFTELKNFLHQDFRPVYNGKINKKSNFTVILKQSLNNGFFSTDLRNLMDFATKDFFYAAGRAFQLMKWMKNNRFCGCCGAETEINYNEPAFLCTKCSNIQYSKISPAIITAVIKNNKILLARSAKRKTQYYSLLAGFVEAGESLEEALHREVFEECGINVKNIRYIYSQPWPFPHTLMCGFICDWAGGTIKVDNREIETADWFSKENMPELPPSISISRQLIDIFLNTQ